MKFKPINLAPKAPDDLPPSLLSSISHISPTGILCSIEVELLIVFQTCVLFHASVPSFYVHYITDSSPEPHEVDIIVLIFQVGGKKECKDSEDYQKPQPLEKRAGV